MKFVNKEVKDGVTLVTIKAENPLNPLTMDILKEVQESVESADSVVVLSGNGRAFSAGADIKNFSGLDPRKAYAFATEGHDVMNSIASLPIPVIAAIHGYALGGGFELALACDMRVATPDAKMGLTEVNLGILPGFGGTQRLRSLAGEGRAFELISTGKIIDATEAQRYGIVNRIGSDHMGEAMKLARELSEKPPLSLRYVKELLRSAPDDNYEAEKEKFGLIFGTEDCREGVDAFLNKRKPVYKGK